MRKLLLMALALVPVMAFAQGFQVNLEGQKQIAMGHTGTGLLQDGAAVFFNPGAVVMLPENYVQAGVSPLMFKSVFNPAGTSEQYHTADKVAPPFTFYAAWGPKASWWKLGMAVYTPFGGRTDWGTTWPGKYTAESLNLKAFYFQPTISIKLADFVSIGAGFVYNRGTVDLTRAIPIANVAGQVSQAELKGSGNGYGWNAGIYFKTQSGVTIGITHRSRVNTTINNGDAIFTVPASLQSSFPQPNQFNASIPLPATNSIGFGFYPCSKWIFGLDRTWLDGMFSSHCHLITKPIRRRYRIPIRLVIIRMLLAFVVVLNTKRQINWPAFWRWLCRCSCSRWLCNRRSA